MAIPGYEFLSAHFSNNERTIVQSWWKSPDGMHTTFEHIEAKPGDPAWENLLTHIDIDALHEATYKQIRAQDEAFKLDTARIAKEKKLVHADNITNLYSVDSMNLIAQFLFGPFDIKKDKEKLFMFKLKLFEVEAIKKSKDRATKAELRKSKSMLDVVKAATKILSAKAVNV